MKIILASNNVNKLREFREILVPMGHEVISQREAGADISPEENGSTFEENAEIKARAIYELLKLPVIADDSGLETDALNGAPGILSARYAPDGQRCRKLLEEMEGVPDEQRTARFVCAVCFIDADGTAHIAKGVCEGSIGYEERGEWGFDYDHVFMYGGRTFAELLPEEKNSVSHRSKALKKLAQIIAGGVTPLAGR